MSGRRAGAWILVGLIGLAVVLLFADWIRQDVAERPPPGALAVDAGEAQLNEEAPSATDEAARAEEPLREGLVEETACAIHGVVFDLLGGPIQGAEVTALCYCNPDSFLTGIGVLGEIVGPRTVGSCTTDDLGCFHMPLPFTADRHAIQIKAPGYLDAEESRAFALWPGQDIDVGRFGLKPCAGLAGRVLDGAGRGIAAASVLVDGEPRATTGEDGGFDISGLSSGRLLLAAQAADSATAPEDVLELHVRAGERLSGLVLIVRTAPEVPLRVQSQDGSPLAGAMVCFWPTVASDWMQRVRTGPDGCCRLRGLVLGRELQIGAQAPGYEQTTTSIVAREGLEVVLSLPVFGSVLVEVDAAGVPNAEIEHIQIRRYYPFRPDFPVPSSSFSAPEHEIEKGKAYRVPCEGTGRCDVEVRGRNFSPSRSKPFEAPGLGGSLTTTVRLLPGASLFGTVADRETGAAIAGARVTVLRLPPPEFACRQVLINGVPVDCEHDPVAETFSAVDGSWSVSGIAEGRYQIHALAPGRAGQATGPLTVSLRAPLPEQRILLDRAARIHGQVTDHLGRPAQDVPVILKYQNGWSGVHSDGNGQYLIEHVPPGQVELFAAWDDLIDVTPTDLPFGLVLGQRERPWTVEVRAGQDLTMDLPMALFCGGVAGEVRLDGQPLALAEITLLPDPSVLDEDHPYPDASPLVLASTSLDGRYEMGPLPAGRYALRLALPDESWGFDHCVVDVPAGAIARADFVLARALIEGSIVRDADFGPMPDARVYFDPCATAGAPGLEHLACWGEEVDAKGHFRDVLPAERDFVCVAESLDETLRSRRIVRFEPGRNDFTIRLVPGGAIEVVLDSGLIRVDGPWLDRGAAPDALVDPARSQDGEGKWRFEPVREGVHRVAVECLGPEGKPVLLEQEVRIAAGGEPEARFVALVEGAPVQ